MTCNAIGESLHTRLSRKRTFTLSYWCVITTRLDYNRVSVCVPSGAGLLFPRVRQFVGECPGQRRSDSAAHQLRSRQLVPDAPSTRRRSTPQLQDCRRNQVRCCHVWVPYADTMCQSSCRSVDWCRVWKRAKETLIASPGPRYCSSKLLLNNKHNVSE